MKQTATLLVVDDIPENVSVLFDFLTDNGFKVLVARNGESALQKVEFAQPHLILLDVMMPGIDGFETCRRLKTNPKTKEIPVIFMTALADTVDKVKGFELGAVDYVTKPIQQEEVLARINTHLMIRNLQQQLQQRNTDLEAKNSELDSFAHTVAHDLKTPLNAIIGFTDILRDTQAERLDNEGREYIDEVLRASYKMLSIIDALLLLAGVSNRSVESENLVMSEIVGQVKRRLDHLLQAQKTEIVIPSTWPVAYGYSPWVEEIWVNYITNAIKYGGQPPRIELGSALENNKAKFWIRDNGPGLSAEAQRRLFTPFTRLHRERAEGHGLGLSIIQRIVEKLGGQVGVESQLGQGSLFYFTLPVAKPEK